MAAEETMAIIPGDMDVALEQSRQSAKRLLDTLARKVGASRAYVKNHSARDIASEIREVAERRPVYALVAAIAAGFLLGFALKRTLRPHA